MANEYPGSLRAYLRQQSRWLRVALQRSRAQGGAQALGLAVHYALYLLPPLLLCLSPLLGAGSASLASLIFLYMLASRLRILKFGRVYREQSITAPAILRLVVYLGVDFAARWISLLHFVFPAMRKNW